MSPRSGRTARVRRPVLTKLAALLAPALLSTGCTSSPLGEPQPEPTRPAAPADAKLDLSRLPIPRGDICGLLAEDDVKKALHGPVSSTHHYGNGDEVEVGPGLRDVSHEFGCVFAGGQGTTARVWVFARPVARPEADSLVRRERHERDCTFPKPVGFGSPSLTSLCERSSTVRARLEGLFGDTWVGCELSGPSETRRALARRAVAWCTDVVTTVGAQP